MGETNGLKGGGDAAAPAGLEADPAVASPGAREPAPATIPATPRGEDESAGILGGPLMADPAQHELPAGQANAASAASASGMPGDMSGEVHRPALSAPGTSIPSAPVASPPGAGVRPSPGRFRETGNSAAAASSDRLPSPQLAGWAVPAASASGMAAPPSGTAGHAAQTLPAAAAGETFAALDAHAGPEAPVWLHAGAQHAEAGFQDPALGWIGVRAELSGGAIHASIVPGSGEAAQALGVHLPALHAHLAEHQVALAALSMQTSAGGSGEQGRQMQQGTGNNPPQQDQTAAPGAPPASAAHGQRAAAVPSPHSEPPWMPAPGTGAHISVMA